MIVWACGCSVGSRDTFWEVVDTVSGVPRFTSSGCSLHKVFSFGLYSCEIYDKGYLGGLSYSIVFL